MPIHLSVCVCLGVGACWLFEQAANVSQPCQFTWRSLHWYHTVQTESSVFLKTVRWMNCPFSFFVNSASFFQPPQSWAETSYWLAPSFFSLLSFDTVEVRFLSSSPGFTVNISMYHCHISAFIFFRRAGIPVEPYSAPFTRSCWAECARPLHTQPHMATSAMKRIRNCCAQRCVTFLFS